MNNLVFVLLLSLVLKPVLWWAYITLPKERWQIIATIPVRRDTFGSSWHGINLTFYGLLLASGCLFGVVIFFLLLASVGVHWETLIGLISSIMIIAMAAAKAVAVAVERKRNTFTVAGGATAGLFLMPLAVYAFNLWGPKYGLSRLELMPVMAGLAIAYAMGEGIGRLACISFGCCYGKPLSELGPLASRIFSRFYTIFYGDTKKIVYASGLAGVKVVPIQAISSFLYVNTSLAGIYLFLEGHFSVSFGLASLIPLGWRVYSEQLRADFRGNKSFSMYQRMALAGIAFCCVFIWMDQSTAIATNLSAGLTSLWNPAAIIFFQILWMGLFLYTGLSKVTGSIIDFHVHSNQV